MALALIYFFACGGPEQAQASRNIAIGFVEGHAACFMDEGCDKNGSMDRSFHAGTVDHAAGDYQNMGAVREGAAYRRLDDYCRERHACAREYRHPGFQETIGWRNAGGWSLFHSSNFAVWSDGVDVDPNPTVRRGQMARVPEGEFQRQLNAIVLEGKWANDIRSRINPSPLLKLVGGESVFKRAVGFSSVLHCSKATMASAKLANAEATKVAMVMFSRRCFVFSPLSCLA